MIGDQKSSSMFQSHECIPEYKQSMKQPREYLERRHAETSLGLCVAVQEIAPHNVPNWKFRLA